MKTLIAALIICLLLAGCATTSTVEQRRTERTAAYSALSEEFRAAADRGEIKVGMPMDAVYIAWGKPAQVTQSATAEGTVTTWFYHGHQLQAYHYWTYHNYRARGHEWGNPYLATEYYPHEYINAEVVFTQGVVSHWRTLPAPGY